MFFKYLRYILIHKWYVFVECLRIGIPLLGILHDLSKFYPGEWLPYMRYFYGKYPTEKEIFIRMPSYTGKTKESILFDFENAWLHHQNQNKHHWQYWILIDDDDNRTVCLPMPDKYRKEMLADWRGAGLALGKPDTLAWYTHNITSIKLNPETRAWIEKTIRL